MKAKPVVPRALANRDIDEAIDYNLIESGERIAAGFIDALQRAYAHISRYPASGSTRHAHELDIPGLRCWARSDYPHLIFYVELATQIDIWRVLHSQRDLPAWLSIASDSPGE